MFYKLLILILLPLLQGMILVDRIAATVNEEVITLSDIEKSLFFYPVIRSKGESDEDLYSRQLDNMINYKIVYLENRSQFPLKDADFENIRIETIRRYGSLEQFRKILNNFDMNESDFMEFVREKVLFEKVVKEKFKFKINVSVSEIRDFYNSKYLPSQKSLGMTPGTMIEVTPDIENFLRIKKINEQLSGWINEIRKSYKVTIQLNKE